jgi:hypothetical protein
MRYEYLYEHVPWALALPFDIQFMKFAISRCVMKQSIETHVVHKETNLVFAEARNFVCYHVRYDAHSPPLANACSGSCAANIITIAASVPASLQPNGNPHVPSL